jgi:hypothetical protein
LNREQIFVGLALHVSSVRTIAKNHGASSQKRDQLSSIHRTMPVHLAISRGISFAKFKEMGESLNMFRGVIIK